MLLVGKLRYFVTLLLIIINIVIFICELFQASFVQSILYHYGVVPSHWSIDSFQDIFILPELFIALLSSQFIHGNILHLLSNMLYLFIFGRSFEPRVGSLAFLIIYLLSGISAGVVHILVLPQSSIPMVGASGAIAGILGAFSKMGTTWINLCIS